MSLSEEQKESIKTTLRESLRKKFKNYKAESAEMPFHTRLLGKDRLALYSFIHSLNTNFGTSIFEPIACEIAKFNFSKVQVQVNAGEYISEEAFKIIQKIISELSTGQKLPNKIDEIKQIKEVANIGKMQKVKTTKIDIYLEKNENQIYLIDLKTAKPNAGGFKEFKRTLLEWVASIFAENQNINISSLIAIPYNPYAPEPYRRWTMRGMIDLEHELKVAEEFWDFLGGENTYENLLDIFELVGLELREEIDEYFKKFQAKNNY